MGGEQQKMKTIFGLLILFGCMGLSMAQVFRELPDPRPKHTPLQGVYSTQPPPPPKPPRLPMRLQDYAFLELNRAYPLVNARWTVVLPDREWACRIDDVHFAIVAREQRVQIAYLYSRKNSLRELLRISGLGVTSTGPGTGLIRDIYADGSHDDDFQFSNGWNYVMIRISQKPKWPRFSTSVPFIGRHAGPMANLLVSPYQQYGLADFTLAQFPLSATASMR